MSNRLGMWGKRLTAGILALWMIGGSTPIYAEDASAAQQRLLDVYNTIQENHVSGVSESALTDAAIKGMVDSLHDPYTTYMTAEELKRFTDSIEQQYVGIGVRYEAKPEGIYVAEIFSGSPAEVAGLSVGDVIVEADGYSFHADGFPSVDAAADELSKRILGKEGTTVHIAFYRNGIKQITDVNRKKIQLPIAESKKFADGIGYIRLASFSSDADKEVAARLRELGDIRSLILDLRDNGGGLLDAARGIAGLFLKEGILMHTSDRAKEDRQIPIQGGTAAAYPIFVLVNENSASASEVLTGALQDYEAAKVVGVPTFGKGSVQQLFPVIGGGMLKVTVEHYFTPKRKPVDHVGITPDIPAEGRVPQLLTALRAAGHTSITAALESGRIIIDGVIFNEFVPVRTVSQDKDEPMVPSRVIASLLGQEVTWEQESQTVILSDHNGGNPVRFNEQNGGFVLKDGTSFLSLSRVQQQVAAFSWERSNEAVVIRTGEGGGTN